MFFISLCLCANFSVKPQRASRRHALEAIPHYSVVVLLERHVLAVVV